MNRTIAGSARVRRRTAALAGLAVLSLSACGDPVEPLEVGHFAFRSDIVLGPPPVVQAEAPVALPPNSVQPRRVIVIVNRTPAPPPPLPEVVIPDLGPCPPASPIAVPKVVAPNNVTLPPAPATYTFRNEGTYEVSGANAGKGSVESESTQTIENVIDLGDGTFDYDVRSEVDDIATITTYHLEPQEVDGEGVVEIVAVRTLEYEEGSGDDADREPVSESTFAPVTPLKILELPIVSGDSWISQGFDPMTGQAMSFNAVVRNKVNVDACGEVLDTYTVEINGAFGPCEPVVVDPLPPVDPTEECDVSGRNVRLMDGTSSEFFAIYQFATQHGGLIVQDFSRVFTDSADSTVFRETTSTINEVPLPPAAPLPAPEDPA